MEEALRKALIRDEFVLHYQPRQQVTSGQITAVEALIRWQHPKLGQQTSFGRGRNFNATH
jgi:EAL domain-containing protein (putative c-di-GMP-specific phosphodiesterase class I)